MVFIHTGWYFLPAPSPPARPLHKERSQASLVTLTSEPLLPSSQNVKHLAGMCCLAAWWGWWSCRDLTQAVACLWAPLARSPIWDVFALHPRPGACSWCGGWWWGHPPSRSDPQEEGWLVHPPSFHVAQEKLPPVKGSGGCIGSYQGFDHHRARSDPK